MDTTHSERRSVVNKRQSDLRLNFTLLSNVRCRPFELWVLFLVFLIFSLQGWFRNSFNFLSCGTDRNRNSFNYRGIKIFVSQSFTCCHFRVDAIIVPIYLPNLEESKGNLSMRKAFLPAFSAPLPLTDSLSLRPFLPLFPENTPVFSLRLAPPIFSCHLSVGRLVTVSPVPPASAWL